MTDRAASDFGDRLYAVAVQFVIGIGGPRVDQAVTLAEDLVASGFTGEATVEVAALRRDAVLSEAESLVLEMLAEHGINLPTPTDEETTYRLLLRAFGFWNLPLGDFYSPFLTRLPSWDQQDGLQRTLIVLFDDLDHATDPGQKREVEERMRAAVRDAFGPPSTRTPIGTSARTAADQDGSATAQRCPETLRCPMAGVPGSRPTGVSPIQVDGAW